LALLLWRASPSSKFHDADRHKEATLVSLKWVVPIDYRFSPSSRLLVLTPILTFCFVFAGQVGAQTVPPSGVLCNGSYTGTFSGNITVSPGQICRFTSGGISGNVIVAGGIFILGNASIHGNVAANSGGRVVLVSSSVRGNLEISGPATFSIGPSANIGGNVLIHDLPSGARENRICASTVSGNLQFQNDAADVLIGASSTCAGNTIRGNLQVQNDSAAVTVFNNTVGGNAQEQNNSGVTSIIGNQIAGNLQVQNNTGSVIVSFNGVQKNLQCEADQSLSGGANVAASNHGCPTAAQSAAFALSDGRSVVFKSPSGASVLTIPLTNQEVVTPGPDGDTTTVSHQRVTISDDGSHVGIYSVSFTAAPTDSGTESLINGTFAYFDATGQLWQITAPVDEAFYLPSGGLRLLTPDGSRVLTIDTDAGNTNPTFTVYDQAGNVVYRSPDSFEEFYQAQISANGQYLLIAGIISQNSGTQNVVRVVDLNTKLSSDFSFDVVFGGVPAISPSSDGRFLISYQGSQTVLP
jgi:hypothetical protein